MGIHKNEKHEEKDKTSKRGSVRNDRRLDAFAQRRKASPADWGGCDPGRLQAIIVGVTAIGGAATFGTSRDGGAYSVTLMLDNHRETLWFNGDADLDAELQSVIDTLGAMD